MSTSLGEFETRNRLIRTCTSCTGMSTLCGKPLKADLELEPGSRFVELIFGNSDDPGEKGLTKTVFAFAIKAAL